MGAAVMSSAEWRALSELEYVLRLCRLEGREETPHYEVSVSHVALALVVQCSCNGWKLY